MPPPSSFTDPQWLTLLSIADGLIPPLPLPEAQRLLREHKRRATRPESDDKVLRFLQCRASEGERFRGLVREVVGGRLPDRVQGEVRLFLNILISTPGSLILNGTLKPLTSMTPAEIQPLILGWHSSRLRPIRAGIKGISNILRYCFLRSSDEFYAAIGFEEPIVPEETERVEGEGSVGRSVLQEGVWMDFEDRRVRAIKTGTLVIGSGSGATSLVNSLARKFSSDPNTYTPLDPLATDILVLEKGPSFSPTSGGKPLSRTEDQGFEDMYESGGILTTQESGISIICASTWGGGSRVNWSACLQTDRKVREEWTRSLLAGQKGGKGSEVDPHGRLFLGREWQDCMDQVEKSLDVRTLSPTEHNPANLTLLEGSRRLGYACRLVPQNISGPFAVHNAECGANCTIGCRAFREGGGKMSGCRAFLRPWMRKREGVRVRGMDGFEVERIVFSSDGRRRAIGAVGRVEGEEILVLARNTVLAAGSMNTPVILLKSSLRLPAIGKNLHLHPTIAVISVWPEEIDPSKGTILTTAITEFDNLDGQGHGVKIEGMNMMPSLGMSYSPWSSGPDFRAHLLKFKHSMGHIVLCRERDTGSITLDGKSGKRLIHYEPSAFDRNHILQGTLGLYKLLYTMGALEMYTNTFGAPRWVRPSAPTDAGPSAAAAAGGWADDPSFTAFLSETEKYGNELDTTSYGSAHQMGTCRMGSDPRSSVVNTRGKVWGVEGLYLADASVFPSGSGVNPMITTMSFGEWVGRRLAEDMISGQRKNRSKL